MQGAALGFCSVGTSARAMSNSFVVALLLAVCVVLGRASHLRVESPRDTGIKMAELVKGVDSALAEGGAQEASQFETSLFSEVAAKQDVLVIVVFQYMFWGQLAVAG